MAESTWEIKRKQREAQLKRAREVLSSINDDNYKDFANEPMFDYNQEKAPKGLDSKERDLWQKYHFMLNADKKLEDEQKNENNGGTGTGVNANANSNANTTGANTNANTNANANGSNAPEATVLGSSYYAPPKNSQTTKPQSAKDLMNGFMNDYGKSVETNRQDTNRRTSMLGEQKNFDTRKGWTQDGYIGFSTLNRDKKRAKRELEKAELNNERLQQYLEIKRQGEDAIRQLKDTGVSSQEIQSQIGDIESQIAGCDAAIEEIKKSDVWAKGTDNPMLKKKLQSIGDSQAKLALQKQTLLEQLKKQQTYENLVPQIGKLAEQQLSVTKDGIKALGQMVREGEYNRDARYKLKIAESMTKEIEKIFGDGRVSDEEQGKLGEIFDGIDTLIEEERDSDPAIREAQDEYDSAKSKFSYYLFDQIKSLMVLLVGLSTGNAQMIYSAMDTYNRKIADAEAEYTTDEIKAFSNNNMKEITGSADAQYALEQLLPMLEQNKDFKLLDSTDRALAVDALYKAFQTYKTHSGEGDFATWYATQLENGNGWAGIIRTLLQAGALNADKFSPMLKKFLGISEDPGVSYNIDTKGKTDSIIDSVLKGMENENATAQVDPKVVRDKQGAVQNALASRLGGQGAAPQGGGTAQPVNPSWGQA